MILTGSSLANDEYDCEELQYFYEDVVYNDGFYTDFYYGEWDAEEGGVKTYQDAEEEEDTWINYSPLYTPSPPQLPTPSLWERLASWWD